MRSAKNPPLSGCRVALQAAKVTALKPRWLSGPARNYTYGDGEPLIALPIILAVLVVLGLLIRRDWKRSKRAASQLSVLGQPRNRRKRWS